LAPSSLSWVSERVAVIAPQALKSQKIRFLQTRLSVRVTQHSNRNADYGVGLGY
jgi:hypothetical protein